jgi:hypothetical protein
LIAQHRQLLGGEITIVEYYWLITLSCTILTAAVFLTSFLRVQVLTRRLLDTRQDKKVPLGHKGEKRPADPAGQMDD